MSETTAEGTVIVINPEGLHARPAEMFVRLANHFEAKVEVIKDGECVDGKSILGILTLFADGWSSTCHGWDPSSALPRAEACR